MVPPPPLANGLLLPSSVLHSQVFAVLAAFVAINTVMYAALAVAKMLPKVYPSDWLQGRNRRVQVRGIYPDATSATSASSPSSAEVAASAALAAVASAASAASAAPAASPSGRSLEPVA